MQREIEGWELQDLRVRQDLRDLWAQQVNQVLLELESQEGQVPPESQEREVAQVEMVPLAQWDPRDQRDTLVPQV